MKIINYKKKKTNIYEITLSNSEKISLYDDVILKYDLLLKKELNDKLKMKIYEENTIFLPKRVHQINQFAQNFLFLYVLDSHQHLRSIVCPKLF